MINGDGAQQLIVWLYFALSKLSAEFAFLIRNESSDLRSNSMFFSEIVKINEIPSNRWERSKTN